MIRSTIARRATAILASTGLALGLGAGIADAAGRDIKVDHATKTVSVHFTSEGWTDVTICTAALTPTAAAPRVAGQLVGGDLKQKIETLTKDPEVQFLKVNGVPFALVGGLLGGQTVSRQVKPNLYALITFCASEKTPDIKPLSVGNPLEVLTGSVGTISSEAGSSTPADTRTVEILDAN